MNELSVDEQEAQQRGDDPAYTVGPWPRTLPNERDPDPAFQPDPNLLKEAIAQFDALSRRHRPHREDVLPYLLIRAFSPGDRGARPTWPPVVCWESPDILLIDNSYSGPFDPGRLVGTPIGGRAYRVFVRLFNLGLMPAVGTHVRVSFVETGFFSGQSGYEPHLIGGTFVDLDDRTRAGAQRVVELDAPWVIPPTLTGHECLIAIASCTADQWSGLLDANQDRHLGQRNLQIAVGSQNIGPLVQRLGGRLPGGSALEVIHGGEAVLPLLNGVVGGRLVGADGTAAERIVAADLARLRYGVRTRLGQHLLTAVALDSASVAAPTDVLAPLVMHRPRRVRHNPFDRPGGAARVLRRLDDRVLRDVALVSGPEGLEDLLPQALRRMLDIGDLRASSVADALIGGYSIVVTRGADSPTRNT